jgi:poly(A) polymerase
MRDEALAIARRLRQHGHQAFLVGGCVRDRLLGVPVKDHDVATSARVEETLAMFPEATVVGAHFGVCRVGTTEVATFRSDHSYRDGRRPEQVSFVRDALHDVLRRDFTINGLLEDPETGEIIDNVNGRQDLSAGVIRAIGDPAERFAEDRLRLLRAVRFAARFGFSIEDGTWAALRAYAPLVHVISAERVRDEINRILLEGGARRGFELLDESGLLRELLPEVAAMQGVAQPPEFHPEGDVWTHTLLLLENLRTPTLTLALGALLHDVGKPPTFRRADRIRFDGHAEIGAGMAGDILRRLRYSNDEIRQVEALVANHLRFKDAPMMKDSTLKRFLRLPAFEEHLELHRLDCVASHRRLDHYEYVLRRRTELPAEALRPAPLLTGDDLIAAGYVPGPEFGRVLRALEEEQLDGRVTGRQQALEWLRHLRR